MNLPSGTVSQLRACVSELIQYCKQKQITLLLVGHVTKEGHIAGPKLVEHMVDTVLYFEGDHTHHFRLLRARKNRYGPADEVGVIRDDRIWIAASQKPFYLVFT